MTRTPSRRMVGPIASLALVAITGLGGCAAPAGVADIDSEPGTPAQPIGCAGAVNWTSASDHIGESTTVEGPVADVDPQPSLNGSPTFINIGEDYPSPNRFTAVIWGDDLGNFDLDPEAAYEGKTICVSGEVTTYNGATQVFVRSPEQVQIN